MSYVRKKMPFLGGNLDGTKLVLGLMQSYGECSPGWTRDCRISLYVSGSVGYLEADFIVMSYLKTSSRSAK